MYLGLGIIAAIALLAVALSGLWRNLVEHMPLHGISPSFLAVLYVLIGIGVAMGIFEWIVGVVAAANAFQGRPYRYPLIGALADRMFNTTPNNSEQRKLLTGNPPPYRKSPKMGLSTPLVLVMSL